MVPPAPRLAFAGLLTLLLPALGARPALAVPAFAVQTSQPCAACHVGAFGPQLKPFGRDFKLHGYVGNDGQDHGLPLAMTARTSFTHTAQPQPGGAAPGFRPNDNAVIDIVSFYYAGKIAANLGGFIEATFDGVAQTPHLDNVDIRHAWEGEVFGQNLLWGVTFNNGPTVQDPWNSTPVWRFPYNRSSLAPTPQAAPMIDWGLVQRSVGVGTYTLWNDMLYAEVAAYKGLSAQNLNMLGQVPEQGDLTTTFLPYARLALIKDWKNQHAEIGAYALSGNVSPWGWYQSYGITTRTTDAALDANYQFILDPAKVTSDMLSAHATYIHEDSVVDGNASGWWLATPHHWLDTVRFDVSYTFAATVTPTVQYFRTTGPGDPGFWWTPNGSPNSDGIIYEIAYVPWGKPDSPFQNVNLRLAVQYVTYFTFDGSSANAAKNNNLYFSLWTALKL